MAPARSTVTGISNNLRFLASFITGSVCLHLCLRSYTSLPHGAAPLGLSHRCCAIGPISSFKQNRNIYFLYIITHVVWILDRLCTPQFYGIIRCDGLQGAVTGRRRTGSLEVEFLKRIANQCCNFYIYKFYKEIFIWSLERKSVLYCPISLMSPLYKMNVICTEYGRFVSNVHIMWARRRNSLAWRPR